MIGRNTALLVLSVVFLAGPVFGDADCKYKGATKCLIEAMVVTTNSSPAFS